MSYSDLKLFALSSNKELAERVASSMGIQMGKSTVRQFSDGEIQVNIEESIRGHHVFILQSTSSPVNDNLMEILIMVDALKRASAEKVSVVMPYYGYARQDRTASPREPITAKLVANMLTTAGADRILTLDLHAVQVQGFFDIPADNLYTVPLFAEYYQSQGLVGDDVVVVAPKNSGIKRARSLADYLESPLAIVDYADDDQKRENGYIIGDVKNKNVILIDDILNTGKTFSSAAVIAKDAGAMDVYAVASHGLFTPGAANRLNAAPISEVLVTDSVKTETPKPDAIKYLSAAPLLAHAIIRIHENKPVSPLFQYNKAAD